MILRTLKALEFFAVTIVMTACLPMSLLASDKTIILECHSRYQFLDGGKEFGPRVNFFKMERQIWGAEYFVKYSGEWKKVCSAKPKSGKSERKKLDSAIKCTRDNAEFHSDETTYFETSDFVIDFEFATAKGKRSYKFSEDTLPKNLSGRTYRKDFSFCTKK